MTDQPTTQAGRDLLRYFDLRAKDILAIEREAVEQERGRIRKIIALLEVDGHFDSCGGYGCADARVADLDAVFSAVRDEP